VVGTRIRDARADDAHAIADIYVASRRVAWKGIIDDVYLDGLDADQEARSTSAFLELPDPPGWGTRVAEDARIVGFLSAGPDEEAPASAHVGALFVAPDVFGSGIGSQLLADAAAQFRALGFVDAYLWTLVDDPRTNQFYVHRGWIPDGGRMTIELDRAREVIRCRRTLTDAHR
jgi:GNAT superfamily N-acetyltransferase